MNQQMLLETFSITSLGHLGVDRRICQAQSDDSANALLDFAEAEGVSYRQYSSTSDVCACEAGNGNE